MSFEIVNTLPILDYTGVQQFGPVKNTSIYLIRNFFSEEECSLLIEEGSRYLEPSRVSGPADTTIVNRSVRSSSTAMLEEVSAALITQHALSRIYSAYGRTHLISNPLQMNRYEVGEEFIEHHDWHNPETNAERIQREGQRTWTFLMYLNEGFQGGETEFPELGISIKPERGMLVLWNNLNEDGTVNHATLHKSNPVTLGSKFMMTKWFKNKVI